MFCCYFWDFYFKLLKDIKRHYKISSFIVIIIDGGRYYMLKHSLVEK